MKINFSLNGREESVDVNPKARMLDVLRDEFDLVGAKEGCGKGECGACTVYLNGNRVNSCLVPAFQMNNSKIVTIEGLQKWPVYKMIEKAYLENGAIQCGFCMSGFVMSTVAYLQELEEIPQSQEILHGLAGNLCRCTGYTKVISAVEDISRQKRIMSTLKKDWQNVFGS